METPDRFAVIADIHGNRWALEAVLEDIARQRISSILNLGDDLSGPLDQEGTAEILTRLNLPSVAGNQDENSPMPLRLELPGMLLFHGTPTANDVYLLETVHLSGVCLATSAEIERRLGSGVRPPLLLCGHTHIPRVVSLRVVTQGGDTKGDTLIVNPGSVGLQAYTDETPFPHAMETGSPHARYAILERHDSGWHVCQRQILYAYEDAAGLALRNGRADWAFRLRTGRAGNPFGILKVP